MSTTISPKYQIVIPKAVRKQLHIKPGQKMHIEVSGNNTIVAKLVIEPVDLGDLSQYVGVIDTTKTAWGKQKIDPATWLRKQRDEEWR